MRLSIGISPCPNDIYIFAALMNGRIDTEGIEFDFFTSDVEELNRTALKGVTSVIKLSLHAYAHAAENYLILDSGGATGRGNGPLVIARKAIEPGEMDSLTIAIPGIYTTANLLFSIAWPGAKKKRVYLFSEIPEVVFRNEADAGIIIHETRFTYHEKGLIKIADLGLFWEEMTGLPVPLGAIAVHRTIPADMAHAVNRIIQRSLDYANRNQGETYAFVKKYSRETDDEVIKKHIGLYVNEFTAGMGEEGRSAITGFFRIASEAGVIPGLPEEIFLQR